MSHGNKKLITINYMKPILIKENQEFILHKSIYTYSVKDGAIQLKRIGDYKGKIKGFVPPTLEEVREFFKEKGYSEMSAEKAWQYYDVAEWKDSKGSQVKNWKQKMMGVWFKDENKIIEKINTDNKPKMIR